MLAEFSLGRGGRSDAVGVFKRLTPGSKWWIIGGLAILAAYLITVFYMVVAGWTLEYLCESVTGALYTRPAPDVAPDRAQYLEAMNSLIYGWWQPVVATVVVVLLNMVILLRGVQKGIEKLSNVLMPVLFVVLVCLVVVSLTLPDARSGPRQHQCRCLRGSTELPCDHCPPRAVRIFEFAARRRKFLAACHHLC